jgi:phosphonate transport system ATP-binding protein
MGLKHPLSNVGRTSNAAMQRLFNQTEMPMNAAIHVDRLNKTFARKTALVDLALSIQPGEMVALIGASGSGKSTLLRHMAGLARCDRSNGGSVQVLGREVQASGRLNGNVRRLRADIGYIFQQFNLVNRLSVLDNVLLGCLGRMPGWRGNLGLFNTEEKQRAMSNLDRVGLADFAEQRASTLSGGQQQRVAIARALTQRAEVILADEPIASLDPESARKVMEILADINRQDGKTVVVTLHQVDYAVRYCQRAVALKAGRIHFDGAASELSTQFLNDLYGADLDTSLLFSDKARNAEAPVTLAFARA